MSKFLRITAKNEIDGNKDYQLLINLDNIAHIRLEPSAKYGNYAISFSAPDWIYVSREVLQQILRTIGQ